MADSSTNPASHRDAVDETSPLLPRDAPVHSAATSTRGPDEHSTPNPPSETTPARISIRGAILASRVLFVGSATSLLLGVALFITYLLVKGNFELRWGLADSLPILGFFSFLCVFLSVVNLVLLAQARGRGETSPSPLGILINVAAIGFFSYAFIRGTSYIIDALSWGGLPSDVAFTTNLLLWLAVGVLLGWVIMPGLVIFWLRGLIIWIRNTGSSITWSLPGGQLTIEASIKFHRQEPLRESHESA